MTRKIDLSVTPDSVNSILVVCSANMCRSPMAEGVLRSRLKDAGLSHISVESASTLHFSGDPATREGVKACAKIGIDISEHRSQPLISKIAAEAGIILVMDGSHIEHINFHLPWAGEKTALIGEFHPTHPGTEIDDPVGMPLPYYENALEEIEQCVDGFIEWLGNK